MKRSIRLSTKADILALLHLAEEAKQTMRRSGNMKQWGEGYPSAETFMADIERDVSYLVVDDESQRAVATFALIPGPDPTYAQIYDGQWIDDEAPYYVIHRIAALTTERGIMQTVLNYAFSKTDNIRIDTHRDNVIMRHLMQKHGFSYCGIIYLANGDERLAFQKRINR
ncbi:MAG: GNAT family N-acetyltransferase [Bacteroidaceae bacterium]|nr:GNAT family N-acetyltransferase [Bacteroidaceae bacterium]